MSSKAALITGASRGIGRALAEVFARNHYDLYLTCITHIDDLKEYAASLADSYGMKCYAFQTDMGSWEEVQDLFTHIQRLDVLINNAAISHIGLLSEMEPETWHRLMQTNVDSCFYTCKLAIPLMLHTHSGRIINISSVWGSVGASMETAYSASKGAVNAFTRALARELAPSNIQVNAVACGIIDTDMNSSLTEGELDNLRAEIPADRIGVPREVAELVYSVSQSPTYMTGQIITIDGGWQ